MATAQRDNPSEVVWWADGTLHLADAAVEVGDVQRLGDSWSLFFRDPDGMELEVCTPV